MGGRGKRAIGESKGSRVGGRTDSMDNCYILLTKINQCICKLDAKGINQSILKLDAKGNQT